MLLSKLALALLGLAQRGWYMRVERWNAALLRVLERRLTKSSSIRESFMFLLSRPRKKGYHVRASAPSINEYRSSDRTHTD